MSVSQAAKRTEQNELESNCQTLHRNSIWLCRLETLGIKNVRRNRRKEGVASVNR